MPPQPFTIDDFRNLLVRCGGLSPSVAIDDPNTTLRDLGVDSACLLAVQVELEDRYGIDLTPEDIPHFATIGGGVARINALIAAQDGSSSGV
jgi:acyl carrier protein